MRKERRKDGVKYHLDKNGHVYFFKDNGLVKIGRTGDLHSRIKSLVCQSQSGNADLLCAIATNDADQLEALFHKAFSEHRRNGEWFDLPDLTDKVFWRFVLMYSGVQFHGRNDCGNTGRGPLSFFTGSGVRFVK